MPFILGILLLFGFTSEGSFPKPFSKEEEQKFLWLFQNGTLEERNYAKQELILHNLRLVAHIAKKYAKLTKKHYL